MDVVMLGGSDAGKTTYVSLMYRRLGDGITGFSCRAADQRVHAALHAAGGDVLSGVYPRNTHQREMHDLVLRYQGADVLPFRWRDYRGEVLTQEGATSAQARELHGDLTEADGILLFADSWRLLHAPGQEQGLEIRHMVTSVLRAFAERDKRITPLVIVLTKFDLVAREGPSAIRRLKEPFGPLIRAAATEPHIRGAVVPLVCGPRPVNVQIPALWVLHSGLVGQASRLRGPAAPAPTLRPYPWPVVGYPAWSWALSRILHAWGRRTFSEGLFTDPWGERARLLPLLAPADRLDGLLKDVDSF